MLPILKKFLKREKAVQAGIDDASLEDLELVVRAALTLEKKMYAQEDTTDALFKLRKSLESIWGHDLP